MTREEIMRLRGMTLESYRRASVRFFGEVVDNVSEVFIDSFLAFISSIKK